MSLEQLITDYGYLAILIVTFIEGETIVILAGFAANLGHLDLFLVIASAIAGSFSGDQFWYYIGRRWGPKVIARRLSWQDSAKKVYALLHRHQDWLILTFRFYYGLRNVTPFVVGAAHVSRLRFFTLNLIGAIVWAIIFAHIGYYLGEAPRLFDVDIKHYELYLLGGLVAIGLVVWALSLLRNRLKAVKRDNSNDPQ